jgi:ubiquinone biosynthesis protein COQ4
MNNSQPMMRQKAKNTTASNFFRRITRAFYFLGASSSSQLDLTNMRSLPVGTFGRAWADFIDRHHLQPLTNGPKQLQQHDGVHVLTGYGADSIGEAELQAFLLGSQFKPRHLFLILGIMRQAKEHERSPKAKAAVWARLRNAYQRGRKSGFNVDAWQPEKLLELPLDYVCAMFKL